MKLKDQSLNNEQIHDIIKLGFINISSYASLIINNVVTLTTGDIIDILPEGITIEDNKEYTLKIEKYSVYYSRYGEKIFNAEESTLITSLFKTLIWCIGNKHIVL